MSEPVRGWEGDSMKSLGHVAYMSQVHVKNGSSEVRDFGFDAARGLKEVGINCMVKASDWFHSVKEDKSTKCEML